MTPGNLVGMAAVQGLDVIALTDHNTARNCPAAMAFGEQYGVMVLPGMELTTEEEVHVVCLFPTLDAALQFDRIVYERLQKVKNDPAIFGEQILCGSQDEPVGTEPYLLINATTIGFEQVDSLVRPLGGVMIPAHVDKTANSLLANLGFVPPDSTFTCAEVRDFANLHRIQREHPYFLNCRMISDSDAHYLYHINGPDNALTVSERTPSAVLEALQNPNI